MTDSSDRVEVFRDSEGDWRWHRRGDNGRILATSGEGYRNLSHALDMAARVNGDIPIHVTS